MDLINIDALAASSRRERFFARSTGTSFDVRAEVDRTVIDIYDEIGWFGVTAKDFRQRLLRAGDITLRINSPGGDVFEGIGIFNDLVEHDGHVRVEVTGMAASIASIIAMGGDEIVIADNAFFMIHNAWTWGIGNRHELRKLSDTLEKIDGALAKTYASRTKAGIRSIKQMMDDETWMTADEAVDLGFAHAKIGDSGAKAKFDVSVYSDVPEALKWADEEDATPETERDWERVAMQDAGWSRSKVRAFKRALTKPTDEPKQDAGEVDLSALAEAVSAVSAMLHTK